MEQGDVIKSLLEANSQLTQQIIELSRALVEARAPQFQMPAAPPVSRGPMFVTESEEDAMAAYAAGDISKDQLENLLQELNFYNAEITVPSAL